MVDIHCTAAEDAAASQQVREPLEGKITDEKGLNTEYKGGQAIREKQNKNFGSGRRRSISGTNRRPE